MRNRLLAIFLSLCLVMGTLSTPVFAASDDLTPPVVKSISMNSPGGTVAIGDTLHFSVEVEDESEIVDATLGFSPQSESSTTSNTIFARFVSYDPNTNIAKVELQIEDNIPSGTWVLSWINVKDYYGNTTHGRDDIDFSSCTFIVTESVGDTVAPVIKAININNSNTAVMAGDSLSFEILVEDESEIVDATLGFSPQSGSSTTSNTIFARFVSYDPNTNIAKVALQIENNIPSGAWVLSWINVKDYYGNTTHGRDDIDFSSCSFIVTESVGDTIAPVIKAINIYNSNTTVTAGDSLSFEILVEDESEIVDATLGFSPQSGGSMASNTIFARFVSYNPNTNIAKAELQIEDNIPSGTWVLSWINVKDYYGNTTNERNEVNLDDIKFTVASSDILPVAVSIPSALGVRVRDVHTIRPTVSPATSVPKWTWTSANTSIAEVTISENGKSCLISGIAPGTTTITGTTQNGLTASCTVTVTDAPLPESGTVNESYQVGVGGYVDIVPTLTPANATTLYEVTSDNPHVAGVGTTAGHTGIRIEGNNAGTAIITIRGANGLVMTTTVKVGRDTDRQHEKVTDPGRPAACNRPGYTDRVRCSACWYVFTESEEIPATGEHTYGEWRVVQVATATTAGLKERYCEVCRERETETIPATGSTPENPGNPGGSSSGNTGNTGSSGSSGNSGNSTSDSTSSPSANKPGTITANSQSIPASINKGTAEVTATGKQLDTIIENAAPDGIVKIDVTAAKNVTELSLSQDVVKAINGSEDVSGLLITTQAGSIEMSGDALQTVTNALTGSNDHVAFKVDTVDVNSIPATQKYPIANVLNSAVFVELSASVIHKDSAGKTISIEPIHEFNGNVTVSVPYNRPANMEGRQIIACYIADDGTITYFPVRYENGVATFTTTHFSTFAVMESRAAAFQDVDISAWYMLGVEYTLQNGLMGGYSDGRFGPNDNLSRAQLAQILYNKEGKPLADGGSSFSDVVAGAWYADAISWAAANGIVGGYGDGRFGPNDNITREQLAVMLWRYSGSPAVTNKELKFSDAGESGSYALDALRWAVENGIINGKGGGILDPKGLATRAQVAQMLKNYLER